MCTMQEQYIQLRNWEAIFPSAHVTEQRSALFVKKLLAVAVSNITYLRNVFPEKAYGDRSLDDLNLKILRDESTCPGACQVIKWVKGCFDALDKKYLKNMIIGIYDNPNDPETVIESYTFKFSYEEDGSVDIYRNDKKISCAYSAEETKKATIKLLRTLIILTNTLPTLPSNVMMTMKLFYYDEVTPKDYEPPGFKPSEETSLFNFNDDASTINVGSVSTSFHTVRLRIKAKKLDIDEDLEKEADSDPADIPITNVGLDKEVDMDTEGEKQKEQEPNAEEQEKTDKDFTIRCPCGCNEDDGIMIKCDVCKDWQHGSCFLITSENMAPKTHICEVCSKPNDAKLKPTDLQLCQLTSIEVQSICLWRRVLSVLTEFKKIVTPQLARRLGIEHTVAQGLINRLEKEGYISTGKKKGKKKELGLVVNKEKIEKEGYPKYLEAPKDSSKDEDKKTEEMDSTTSEFEKDMNSLTDSTEKIKLSNRKKKKSPRLSQVDSSKIDAPDRRARKRGRSQTNDIGLEIINQEDEDISSAKKASKVKHDIAL